ncbi:hypothetical protein Rt10032_c16g5688 [Rhodotorula toruloides]|uniref:Hemerythrin-like domain-containing protein n=1 Tax=Rhodotorula toruloides TaxID=5286 RepID=A0A511KMU2_RHOTO|nr:hypothetical protein Rt10032_c16g5688 [Rhodotorula toruloides]
MSIYTLDQAIKPSRASISTSTGRSKGGKARTGDIELPDYIAPEPKNAAERRDWERMSSAMEGFHSYFRHSFRQLFELSDGSFEKRGMTVRDFMRLSDDFTKHLEFHHGIEEQHIFPILAKRMPQFRDDHQEEHDTIHEGMDSLKSLTKRLKVEPNLYSPDEFRKNLASWGPILFYHLDAEVASLKPDVLRRYWTLAEVKQLPM